jgi:hypothetical protein
MVLVRSGFRSKGKMQTSLSRLRSLHAVQGTVCVSFDCVTFLSMRVDVSTLSCKGSLRAPLILRAITVPATSIRSLAGQFKL